MATQAEGRAVAQMEAHIVYLISNLNLKPKICALRTLKSDGIKGGGAGGIYNVAQLGGQQPVGRLPHLSAQLRQQLHVP